MFSGTMPDVTPAQVTAFITFIVSQVVAWGWIDNNRGQVLVSIGGIVLPAVLKFADAIIRHGRATSTTIEK